VKKTEVKFEQEMIGFRANSFKLVEISLKVGIVYTSFITILYHKIIIVFND
jgi:hypothetical protein